ncbi:hypothetical protein D3C71_19070 [compost metagenome]
MRQVHDSGLLPVPSYLKAVTRSLAPLRTLKRAQEERYEYLVGLHLAELTALAQDASAAREDRLQALRSRRAALLTQEWFFLRGTHPALLTRALREADMLEHQLARATA